MFYKVMNLNIFDFSFPKKILILVFNREAKYTTSISERYSEDIFR